MAEFMLERMILDAIQIRHQLLIEEGRLPTSESLQQYFTTFRARFGPERLAQLRGEELLYTMHAHGDRDSLVYWLEFKNDEQFPDLFGSIAGGSALKFGIYRRKETGAWMTDRGAGQVPIDVAEAIRIATRNRDQLLAGVRELEALSPDPSDPTYAALQHQLNDVAPDVSDSAWGHKYFSLIFPQKLDDFHVADYQRFYLRKMLQVPPEVEGRYAAAGRYVSAAAELRISLNHLTATLKSLYGRPHRVWRIGTRLGGEHSIWSLMKSQSCVAIGWPSLGDLSELTLTNRSDGRASIRKQLEADGEVPTTAGRDATQITHFATKIEEGDLVLAADGKDILGIGSIIGPYRYKLAESDDAPHQRPVTWLDTATWKLPESSEGLRSTVRELKKFPINLVAIERRILDAQPTVTHSNTVGTRHLTRTLEGIPGRLQAILERKGQAILHGPPGTGKTHWATWTARQLAAQYAYGRDFESISPREQLEVTGSPETEGLVRSCTFHPGYGYEDFIEGFRPNTTAAAQLHFDLRPGLFKRLCEAAERSRHRKFYLLIDEINRGDIPRIFGELITLLEIDKRSHAYATLPLSSHPLTVPPNVFIIGTMNAADRSIALLDTALRRRFGFVELMPDHSLLRTATIANSIPLGDWLAALNQRLRSRVSRDARNLQIGHAYFMEGFRPVTSLARFTRILAEDIVPLLEEYCYENYGLLSEILGSGLVDVENQCIRVSLFEQDQQGELISALLQPCPEIATSAAAVAAEPEPDSEDDADEGPGVDVGTG
jgi:5-methylcytosine-specific restriction enzyme B